MNNQHTDLTLRSNAKLKAQIVPARGLTLAHKVRMFELMQKYYEQVTREQFLKDLSKKHEVILLLDERDKQIQGFSTLMKLSIRQDGRESHAIFSGDTVIEKSVWGQRALGKAFLRYLFKEKLRRPLQPLYWLLITKGYKTYLMMANNFTEYYPRFDKPTPADKKALLDNFYSTLYASDYDAASGLIQPKGEACHLKTGVANISPSLIESNPKIAFFQSANPGWQQGFELACIAQMTLWMPLQYALKAFVVDRLMKPLTKWGQKIGSPTVKEGAIEKRLR
jgi:hypothetical protein